MAFRKNKNLRNYLVRAKLKTNPHDNHTQNLPDISLQIEHQPPPDNPTIDPFHTPDDSVSFCPIRSCFLHKYLNKSLKIHCTITNRFFRIRGTFNCNSKHIIYLMQCNKCKNNISDKQAPAYDIESLNTLITNKALIQLSPTLLPTRPFIHSSAH